MRKVMLVSIVVLASSCGTDSEVPWMRETAPVEVIGKRHEPERRWTEDCSGYEYNFMSGEYEWHFETCSRYEPERWVVAIRQCDHVGHPLADSSGCLSEERGVSWYVWDRVARGDRLALSDLARSEG